MAVVWSCSCGKYVTGSASRYGSLCDDCSGKTASLKAEAERWRMLTPDQKCDELKDQLDAMGHDWHNVQIG